MQNSNNNRNYKNDDEIDLGYLLDLIKRNKYLIFTITCRYLEDLSYQCISPLVEMILL